MSENIKKLITVYLVPATVLLCSLLFYGSYYGWVDDIVVMNTVSAQLTGEPVTAGPCFLIINKLLATLYQIYPRIAWYGYFMISLSLLILINIASLIYRLVRPHRYKYLIASAIFIVFFLLLLNEMFIALNFTKLALMLSGSSLLRIILQTTAEKDQNKARYTGLYIQVLIGILIRYSIIIPVICCILLIAGILKINKWNIILRTSAVSGILILSALLYNQVINSKKEASLLNSREIYLLTLLDGQNYSSKIPKYLNDDKEKMRFKALQQWYYYDEDQINVNYLTKISYTPSQFEIEELCLRFYHKLKYAYYKSISIKEFDTDKSCSIFIKFLSLQIILWILFFILLYKAQRKQLGQTGTLQIVFAHLFFILINVTIIGVFKYEDRLFSPFTVITIGIYLILIAKHSYKLPSTSISTTVFIVFACLILFRAIQLKSWAQHKQSEQRVSSKVIDDINYRFKDKILIFDYFSMLFFHKGLFETFRIDRNIVCTSYGENPYHGFLSHHKYLREKVYPFTNFISFFDGIGNSKTDRYIFMISDFRAKMLNEYFQILYARKYRLKQLILKSKFEQSTITLFGSPIHFNCYVLRN